MKILTVTGALACFLLAHEMLCAESRAWTSTAGTTLEAEYVSSDGVRVTLKKKSDGKTLTLPLSQLSEADRKFAEEQLAKAKAAMEDENGPKVAGEIRSPKEGEKTGQVVEVKGRTRDVPEGMVAMVFRVNRVKDETFPHGEVIRPNRAFETTVHHREGDAEDWGVDLYILPEADAKELALWYAGVVELFLAQREKEIKPYDLTLLERAIKLTGVNYSWSAE